MAQPDVSILIVSWNAKDYLAQCLASIRQTQGDLKIQVVVVDNASHDGSPEMVERDFPEVALIRTGENLGFAKGNNAGLGLCEGRYVALINSDIVLRDGCLQGLIHYMETQPEVGLVGPRIVNPDGTFQSSARQDPDLWSSLGRALFLDHLDPTQKLFPKAHMRQSQLQVTRPVPVLVGCFWLTRREALQKVGGLDPNFFIYGEDNDWCRRFADKGWQIMYYRESEAIHFGGASSSIAPIRFYVEMYKARLQYWKKHQGIWGRLFGPGILAIHFLVRYLVWSVLSLIRPRSRQRTSAMRARYFAALKWLFFNVSPHKTSG